jgi:hypothetical protein
MSLVAIEADYVFTRAPADDYLTRYRQLGRYIPEGSKPGAMAAAVYVVHRVLPLDYANFGRLPAQTLHALEAFVARAKRFSGEAAHLVHACIPFAPDSNLICLALNPRGNTTISGMNDFVRRLYDQMRIDPHQPLQLREFFGSTTTLRADALGREAALELLRRLNLPASSNEAPWQDEPLLILRHTIMNPFLLDTENGVSYIDKYFEFLVRRMEALRAH